MRKAYEFSGEESIELYDARKATLSLLVLPVDGDKSMPSERSLLGVWNTVGGEPDEGEESTEWFET